MLCFWFASQSLLPLHCCDTSRDQPGPVAKFAYYFESRTILNEPSRKKKASHGIRRVRSRSRQRSAAKEIKKGDTTRVRMKDVCIYK